MHCTADDASLLALDVLVALRNSSTSAPALWVIEHLSTFTRGCFFADGSTHIPLKGGLEEGDRAYVGEGSLRVLHPKGRKLLWWHRSV